MFLYICEGKLYLCARSTMYSKEFMKFLFGYQKEEFKPKDSKNIEIRFKNNRGGKLAEIPVTNPIKQE